MKTHSYLVLTFAMFCLAGSGFAEEESETGDRVLQVNDRTPKLEVRHSQIGYRSTLLFYTFKKQHAVLKLQIGNRDKTFPITATVYRFADGVTEEGLKK